MIYYPEVCIVLNVLATLTTTSEPRPWKSIRNYNFKDDGKIRSLVSNNINVMKINITQWMQHTVNKLITFDD